MGKIIVIDGVDGSGKGTQYRLLKDRLEKEKYVLYKFAFPRYKDEASIFIRRYLEGMYGERPGDVSAYQASLCYAMDRFDAIKANPEFRDAMTDPNVIMLTDRYTTSNLIHQGPKITDIQERKKFNSWLWNLEYEILGIPKPDMVIIPILETEANIQLIRNRDISTRANDNNMSKDIHESDNEYLRQTIATCRIIVEQMGFDWIDCMTTDGKIRDIEDIHEEIYGRVHRKVLSKVERR